MPPTPDCASLAASETETELEYQPVTQLPPLQEIVVAGAVPSATAENGAPAEARPALFVAVTAVGPTGTVAPLSKV